MDRRELKGYRNLTVGGMALDEALDCIERFHGSLAPGIVLGGFMVDIGQECMAEGVLYNAVVESRHCLPDAVQIFTPCTIGNTWLRVEDYGRFAITLYDKDTGSGVRVWVDIDKLDPFPEVKGWFLKRIPKSELPTERLLPAILEAGRAIFSHRNVQVEDWVRPAKKGNVGICPQCGESYPIRYGKACRACTEGAYFSEADPAKPDE